MLYSLTLDIGGAIDALPGGNPFKYTDLGHFVSNVIGVGITLAAIATLLYLLWGGFEWITSGGDKTAVENARNKITHAIIGLIIVVCVWVLFGFVQWFLGVSVTSGNYGGSSTVAAQPTTTPYVQPAPQGYSCPGPHCDRCPNSNTGQINRISCSSTLWIRNAGCPTAYPDPNGLAVGCTKQ